MKGLSDDEENDVLNRSGMEVALGEYPNRQYRQPGGKGSAGNLHATFCGGWGTNWVAPSTRRSWR